MKYSFANIICDNDRSIHPRLSTCAETVVLIKKNQIARENLEHNRSKENKNSKTKARACTVIVLYYNTTISVSRLIGITC